MELDVSEEKTNILNAREERFVLGLVKGKSQRVAYKEAYPSASKWKDSTIDSKACRLFKEDKIRARYDELMEELKQEAMYTKGEAINDLIWIKEKAREDILIRGVKQANTNTFLKAVNELCTIEDLYPKGDKDDNENEKAIASVLKEALGELENDEELEDYEIP